MTHSKLRHPVLKTRDINSPRVFSPPLNAIESGPAMALGPLTLCRLPGCGRILQKALRKGQALAGRLSILRHGVVEPTSPRSRCFGVGLGIPIHVAWDVCMKNLDYTHRQIDEAILLKHKTSKLDAFISYKLYDMSYVNKLDLTA